jgi:tRNA(Arg) A34 adenosine deaminase TadA
MWARLSLPWQACLEQAWEACCAGTVPIGAAIAGPDGQVLAVGRNRIYQAREASLNFISGVRVAHAEMNALIAFDFQSVDPRQCTLYTTTEPCPMCAGAIVMANIRNVCYATRDIWAGSTDLYQANHYLRRKNMHVEEAPDFLFRDLLVALQVDYFLREDANRGKNIGNSPTHPIFSCLAEVSPSGAQFGLRIFQNGKLDALRSSGGTAAQSIDKLENWFIESGGNNRYNEEASIFHLRPAIR